MGVFFFKNFLYLCNMKVIFLDHDGVICLSNNWGGRTKKWAKYRSENPDSSKDKKDAPVSFRFDDFDTKSVKVLNEILEETGAEIVVSSDWKLHATLEELGEYYELHGISKKPISLTPNLKDCTVHGNNFIWSPRWDLEQTRTIEIKQYLHDHPEVTHWVSIDDLNMGKIGEPWKDEWAIDNFVLTPKQNEGIKQSGVKEKILNYLT
jgi:HAD domain in Swiss Army Knife RNA repair proteins